MCVKVCAADVVRCEIGWIGGRTPLAWVDGVVFVVCDLEMGLIDDLADISNSISEERGVFELFLLHCSSSASS